MEGIFYAIISKFVLEDTQKGEASCHLHRHCLAAPTLDQHFSSLRWVEFWDSQNSPGLFEYTSLSQAEVHGFWNLGKKQVHPSAVFSGEKSSLSFFKKKNPTLPDKRLESIEFDYLHTASGIIWNPVSIYIVHLH